MPALLPRPWVPGPAETRVQSIAAKTASAGSDALADRLDSLIAQNRRIQRWRFWRQWIGRGFRPGRAPKDGAGERAFWLLFVACISTEPTHARNREIPRQLRHRPQG